MSAAGIDATNDAGNGCKLQTGDLLGTGTISAATDDGFGECRAVVLPAVAA